VYLSVFDMGIQRIGESNKLLKKTDDGEEDSKPLVRDYGKEVPEIYGAYHKVISGSVSKSRLWCMIHTEEYVVLIKSSSSAMQELFNSILPALSGKYANALVAEPVKKNKYGACIGVDDETKVWYIFDPDALTFETSDVEPEIAKKQQSLNLSMFLDVKAVLDSSLSDRNTTVEEEKPSIKRKRKKPTEEPSDTGLLQEGLTKTPIDG